MKAGEYRTEVATYRCEVAPRPLIWAGITLLFGALIVAIIAAAYSIPY